MKTNSFISLVCLCLIVPSVVVAQKDKEKKKKGTEETTATGVPVLKTLKDSVAYAIGISIAQNLQVQGLDSVNADALRAGLLDFRCGKGGMSPEDANKFLNEYFQKGQAKKFDSNKMDGEKFLTENKSKPGVKTLPDGMQYIVMKEGDGPMPTLSDKVKTHYHGTLISGKVFDSSVDRGEPVSFPVGGVIKGWTEALQLMKVGSKWKLFIPSELAYGEQGAGGVIEPYATLIFEVELLSIEK